MHLQMINYFNFSDKRNNPVELSFRSFIVNVMREGSKSNDYYKPSSVCDKIFKPHKNKNLKFMRSNEHLRARICFLLFFQTVVNQNKFRVLHNLKNRNNSFYRAFYMHSRIAEVFLKSVFRIIYTFKIIYYNFQHIFLESKDLFLV